MGAVGALFWRVLLVLLAVHLAAGEPRGPGSTRRMEGRGSPAGLGHRMDRNGRAGRGNTLGDARELSGGPEAAWSSVLGRCRGAELGVGAVVSPPGQAGQLAGTHP